MRRSSPGRPGRDRQRVGLGLPVPPFASLLAVTTWMPRTEPVRMAGRDRRARGGVDHHARPAPAAPSAALTARGRWRARWPGASRPAVRTSMPSGSVRVWRELLTWTTSTPAPCLVEAVRAARSRPCRRRAAPPGPSRRRRPPRLSALIGAGRLARNRRRRPRSSARPERRSTRSRGVLDADRQPQQPVADAGRRARLRRHRQVGHRRRVRDQALDAAERLGEREAPQPVDERLAPPPRRRPDRR